MHNGRCAEFSKIAQATSVGFFIMGFIGFFVKLIFIPINKSDIMRFEPQTCVPLTWCAANYSRVRGPHWDSIIVGMS